MLVLTVRPGEKVILSGGIVVTLVLLERGKIRLGFEAPLEIDIDREEVWKRKNNPVEGE